MTNEQIKVIIRVLKEHIDCNEDYTERQTNLTKDEIEEIRNESSICAKMVNELQRQIDDTKW